MTGVQTCALPIYSRTDVEAARNAGVSAWVVPYGYNAGVPIAEAAPDRIFQGLQEVAQHVLDCCAQTSSA